MNKVISVDNDKAKSMIYYDEGVRFINKSVDSVEAFNEIFNKKLSLTDKGELKYQDMKKLTLNGLVVNPHTKMKLGNSVSDVSFTNENDRDEFIEHVSNLKGWSKKETQLTPLNAAKWDLAGFIITPVMAYFFYNKALKIEVGTLMETSGFSKAARQSRLFDSIMETIGSKGVLIVAVLIFAYLGYSVYKKYKNPPVSISYE